ncbi:MAG: hypothetical protein KTR31_23805 [Myxococcales bacterium]|nr:hypothetical protein [Myxococcales bacterium]
MGRWTGFVALAIGWGACEGETEAPCEGTDCPLTEQACLDAGGEVVPNPGAGVECPLGTQLLGYIEETLAIEPPGCCVE